MELLDLVDKLFLRHSARHLRYILLKSLYRLQRLDRHFLTLHNTFAIKRLLFSHLSKFMTKSLNFLLQFHRDLLLIVEFGVNRVFQTRNDSLYLNKHLVDTLFNLLIWLGHFGLQSCLQLANLLLDHLFRCHIWQLTCQVTAYRLATLARRRLFLAAHDLRRLWLLILSLTLLLCTSISLGLFYFHEDFALSVQ